MNDLIERIQSEAPSEITYEWLGEFVRNINIKELDYTSFLPELSSSNDYARNILCLEPFECVLLYWPPGVESAVHYHKGFWGYVLCLEGAVENIEYKRNGHRLCESKSLLANRGGVLNEPDGTIHKIVNASKTDFLVTLHFYWPALETLDQLKVYDLEGQRILTLNEKAPTASSSLSSDQYHSIEEDAFEYHPLDAEHSKRSHRVYPIIPKPTSSEISRLIGGYYKEQALEYDSFDLKHHTRRKYLDTINHLIADRLRQSKIGGKVLDLACGTGRRALTIQESAGTNYQLMGVDLSPEMCEVAQSRGVNAIAGNWLDVAIDSESVDAVTFLYAYGHIPSEEERREALRKVLRVLKPGGLFFFDTFNMNDKNEWGPQALRVYREHHLGSFGYEEGDVFYKKIGGEQVAFLHYCEEQSLVLFLEDIGFQVEEVKHIGYVYRSGEILSGKDEGSLFIIARKG